MLRLSCGHQPPKKAAAFCVGCGGNQFYHAHHHGRHCCGHCFFLLNFFFVLNYDHHNYCCMVLGPAVVFQGDCAEIPPPSCWSRPACFSPPTTWVCPCLSASCGIQRNRGMDPSLWKKVDRSNSRNPPFF